MRRTKALEIITSKVKCNGKLRNMDWLKYTENNASDKHNIRGMLGEKTCSSS